MYRISLCNLLPKSLWPGICMTVCGPCVPIIVDNQNNIFTTGWLLFICVKRLFASETVLFIRQASRQPTNLSWSVLSTHGMLIGILATVNNSPFTVFYNPLASPSEFVIPVVKYYKAKYSQQVSLGMRFGTMFETDESRTRRFVG